jgi:hypothetical protein
MPSVATQTDFSLTSETGYLGWLKENRDIADGIPSVEEHSPKDKLTRLKTKTLWDTYNKSEEDK